MKNKVMLAFASVLALASANVFAVIEVKQNLRTKVYNETDREIRATWTASSTLGQLTRGLFGAFKDSKFQIIKSNDDYAFWHTGDTLVVRYTACVNGKPTEQDAKYDTDKEGYGKDGITVSWDDATKSIKITPRGGKKD